MAWNRKLHAGLVLAIALYVGLRWLILYTAFDQTAMTMYELYPMGTIPKFVMDGHALPLLDYYDNAVGQLATGFLAVPFYEVLGPTYLALKLVPASLGLLALVLIYVFLRANFDRGAAALGAVLFAVGPTTMTKYSLMASGNHFENLFFVMLALCCFYRAHTSAKRTPWLLLSGFTSGLAIFVFLGALVPVAVFAAMHLAVRGLKGSVKDAGLALGPFVLGLLPFLILNLGGDGRGVAFLDAKFTSQGGAGLREGFAHMREFLAHLPRAGVYEPWAGMPGAWAGHAFFSATAAAYVILLPDFLRGLRQLLGALRLEAAPAGAFEKMKLLPLMLYMPISAVAYGASNLQIGGYAPPIEVAGFRYYLPSLLCAVMLIAIAARRLRGSPLKRAAGVALAFLALGTGLFNLGVADLSLAQTGVGSHYRGYSHDYVARSLLRKINYHSQDEVIELAAQFGPIQRQNVYRGIGIFRTQELVVLAQGDPSLVQLRDVLEGYPDVYHQDLARGAGIFLRPPHGDLLGAGARSHDLVLRWIAEGQPFAQYAVEGLCLQKGLPLARDSKRLIDENTRMLAQSDSSIKSALQRGHGILSGDFWRRGIAGDEELVRQNFANIDATRFPDLCSGFGRGLAAGAEVPELPEDGLLLFDAFGQAHVLNGFAAALRHDFTPAELEPLLAAWRSEWPVERIASLEDQLSQADPLGPSR